MTLVPRTDYEARGTEALLTDELITIIATNMEHNVIEVASNMEHN